MPEGIALPFKALAYQQLNENRFEKVPENFFYQETMCQRDWLLRRIKIADWMERTQSFQESMKAI